MNDILAPPKEYVIKPSCGHQSGAVHAGFSVLDNTDSRRRKTCPKTTARIKKNKTGNITDPIQKEKAAVAYRFAVNALKDFPFVRKRSDRSYMSEKVTRKMSGNKNLQIESASLRHPFFYSY